MSFLAFNCRFEIFYVKFVLRISSNFKISHMNASGAARTEIDIVDYSVLLNTALKGVTVVLGVTERGVPGKPYSIGSWEQYEIDLGGLLYANDFPLYCKRALDEGAPLVVIPVAKYADPSNPATISGNKAIYTNAQSALAAAGASATTVLSIVNIPTSDSASIFVKIPGQSDVAIADSVALTSSDTKASTITAITTAINAGTGAHGFSVVADTASGLITITAPLALGAWGRKLSLSVVAGTGLTFTAYNPPFTGGNDTTTTNGTTTLTALAKGGKYNSVTVEFVPAISNNPNLYDIYIRLADSKAPEEITRDVPKLASDTAFTSKVSEVLANSRLLSAMSFSSDYVLQPGTVALSGGTDGSTVLPADYVGNREAGTNLYAADGVSEASKICIPAIADPILAKSLADYVDDRKDMMALHRTPIGISPQRVLDYRYGTGSYNHAPIDSWRSLMFTGGIIVTDPLSGLSKNISEIGDVIAVISRKDTKTHEWFSFAGETRGVIRNTLAVITNVAAVGKAFYANAYDAAGIIPVVQDAKKKRYISGDNSLQRKATLLKKSNVGELLTFMYRTLQEIIKIDFPPNDVESWKTIYRNVQPWLEFLKNNRAIWDYKYIGDQDIMDVSQAIINRPENVDAGMYKFRILIQPKVNMKYISVTIGVLNSGMSFDDISIED